MTNVPDKIGSSATTQRQQEARRAQAGDRFALGGAGGSISSQKVAPGDTLASVVGKANPGATEAQLQALTGLAREANGFGSDLIPGPRASVLVPKLDAPAAAQAGAAQDTRAAGAVALPVDRSVQAQATAEQQAQRKADAERRKAMDEEPARVAPSETPEQMQKGNEVLAALLARTAGGAKALAEAGLSHLLGGAAASGSGQAAAPSATDGRKSLAPEASAREVSDHLAAIPEAERGKAAAALLANGTLTRDQLAGYVLGSEAGRLDANTALARAGSLLGSTSEPAVREAVGMAVDKLLPHGSNPESVKHFEQKLQSFFGNDKVSEAAKRGLVEAMNGHANGTARSAVALTYAEHTNDLDRKVEQAEHEVDLAKAHRDGPAGSSLPRAEHDKRIAEAETKLQQAQAARDGGQEALSKLLSAPIPWNGDPGQPQTALGDLRNFIGEYRQGSQTEAGKSVMLALFDPPSPQGVQCIADLTSRIEENKSSPDALALGFMFRSGREAFLDIAKKDKEGMEKASKALHFALGIGLGMGSKALGEALGIANEVAKKLLSAGMEKVSRAGLDMALGAMGDGVDADAKRWKALTEQTLARYQKNPELHQSFLAGYDSQYDTVR